MDNREFAKELLAESVNILESTGSAGLRRKIEIEREKSNIDQANKKIDEIMKLKSKTRSKHKLAKMDERIDQLNGVKNICERDMKRSEAELKNKGSKTKKDIDKFGETYALQQARLKTNIDKGIAESMMKKHKYLQNESVELATLLTEAAELLNESSNSNKLNVYEVCELLKEVEAPLGIKLSTKYIKDILKDGICDEGEYSINIAEYHDNVNDKKCLRLISKYVAKLNKIAKKYGFFVNQTVDKYPDEVIITIWINNK